MPTDMTYEHTLVTPFFLFDLWLRNHPHALVIAMPHYGLGRQTYHFYGEGTPTPFIVKAGPHLDSLMYTHLTIIFNEPEHAAVEIFQASVLAFFTQLRNKPKKQDTKFNWREFLPEEPNDES